MVLRIEATTFPVEKPCDAALPILGQLRSDIIWPQITMGENAPRGA